MYINLSRKVPCPVTKVFALLGLHGIAGMQKTFDSWANCRSTNAMTNSWKFEISACSNQFEIKYISELRYWVVKQKLAQDETKGNFAYHPTYRRYWVLKQKLPQDAAYSSASLLFPPQSRTPENHQRETVPPVQNLCKFLKNELREGHQK